MEMNKVLKNISVILECSFIGSVILYVYNFYTASKKYEILPVAVKTRLNIFVIIAVVSVILFLILRYVLYIRNKTVNEEYREPVTIEEKREIAYKNLEAPVSERVFIYKDEYEVPKERRMLCPNCSKVIDKNAYICVKCGYLLKKIEPKVVEKIVEKVVEKPVQKKENKLNSYDYDRFINLLITLGLIVGIIICATMIVNLAMERGIIG